MGKTHNRVAAAQRAVMATSLAAGLLLVGCAGRREVLTPPSVLVAPYDSVAGDVLWAVTPLANESGASVVDPAQVTDQVIAAITEANGLQAVPLNRTIAAMRALELPRISTPGEAQQLAQALGVDGIVVGSITAYDPYDPPRLGLTLALFGRDGAMEPRPDLLDNPRLFAMQATDARQAGLTGYDDKPLAVAARHLDARDHDVLIRLRQYAEGRSDPTTALGWRVHTASMELYTKFAAQALVGELLDIEWLRLAGESVRPPT